jgi:hypothetical protein
MHIFEIDHIGTSREIWEEIERMTRELKQSAVPSVPPLVDPPATAASESARPVYAPLNDSNRSKLPFNDQPSYSSEDTISNSGQVDISDDLSRLNYVLAERMADQRQKAERHKSLPARPLEAPGSDRGADMRKLYFDASCPPRLSGGRPEASKPPRHTTMRLSDVLNDVETETLARETTPLLASFEEGALTPEGQRQVRNVSNGCASLNQMARANALIGQGSWTAAADARCSSCSCTGIAASPSNRGDASS